MSMAQDICYFILTLDFVFEHKMEESQEFYPRGIPFFQLTLTVQELECLMTYK